MGLESKSKVFYPYSSVPARYGTITLSTKTVHDSIAIYHLRVGFAWLSAGGWSGFMSHTFLVRYVIVAYRPGMPRSRCVPGEYAS